MSDPSPKLSPIEELTPFIQALARATAMVCHEIGFNPDMNDPEVAREIMMTSFNALLLSPEKPRRKAKRKAAPADKAPSAKPGDRYIEGTSGARMSKVVVTKLSEKRHSASSKEAPVAEKRMRDVSTGQLVTVRTLDGRSKSFGDDLTYVFKRNVAKARRDNKKVSGVTDRAPAKG